jgi:hypothetical protein
MDPALRRLFADVDAANEASDADLQRGTRLAVTAVVELLQRIDPDSPGLRFIETPVCR